MSANENLLEIIPNFYLASQLDVLHLSLINLLDMVKDGEIDLVLEQNKKSETQKKLFLEKIVKSVESKELRQTLQKILDAGNINYFQEKSLGSALLGLQKAAEGIHIVHLQTAVEFKDKDLKEMVELLEERIQGKVALDITVDPTLIAGAIIQYGNYISDYSVRTRLNQFRGEWHAAVVESK